MKKKLKFENDHRQTKLDQFLKPINTYCNNGIGSDDEIYRTNSSLSCPNYGSELRHSFDVSPRAQYRKFLKPRKCLSDAALLVKVMLGHKAAGDIDECFATTESGCIEKDTELDDKNEEVLNHSKSDLQNEEPVVSNPASIPEVSPSFMKEADVVSLGHDSNACSSMDLTTSQKMDISKDTDILELNATNNRPNRQKCVKNLKRKQARKKSRKSESSKSFILPRVHTVTIGAYELKPPYSSPLPLELVKRGHVYVCEKCLDFKESEETLKRHIDKCWFEYPPGDEIFRQDGLSVFEVDGNISKVYCQNLCLLAKLFIEHKTLFYDVEPFLFYVLTVIDSTGYHFVGYFSKQKCSLENNLSCIVTLPSYQNKGYGRFLIDFSFLLSRREGTTGTPERPLSNMGSIAYRSYWQSVVLEFFKRPSASMLKTLSVEEISRFTGVSVQDIIETMRELEMFQYDQNGEVSFIVNHDLVNLHWAKVEHDSRRVWIDEDNLKWKPKQYSVADYANAN